MKLAGHITPEILLKNGFKKVSKNGDDYEWVDYKLILDYSRRGQHYYLGVKDIHIDKRIYLEATEPDGSGGSIFLDNTIIELFEKGIFVKS